MHQTVTLSLPIFVALLLVLIVVTGLITRFAVLRKVRREEVRAVAEHLHSMFKHGQLHAIRFATDGEERIFARGADSNCIPVPVRIDSPELAPGNFVGIEHADLRDAVERLRKSRRYKTVDWHEAGKDFKELKLREEFLGENHRRA